MARPVVRISDIAHRIPEAGRIRLGVKSGKGMKALNTFRFTSPDRDVIEQLAARYGGVAKPWSDPKASPQNQFEVITASSKVDVYLPRDALSSWYEMWSGGGVQRRCDGQECQIPVTTPAGWEMSTTPCICVAKQSMECRPYSRLNVIIPSVAFRGVWRLETKGWNAMHELPGMTQLIESLAQAGTLVRAELGIQQRVQMTPAGKRNFVVPTISLASSAEEIVSGQANVRALMTAMPTGDAVAELVAAPTLDDDGIIDAEVVTSPLQEWEDRFFALCAEHRIPFNRFWPALLNMLAVDNGVLSETQAGRMSTAYDRISEGSLTFAGFDPNGKIIFTQA